eukprot:1061687-Prorocentrum_minimum.AAC.2
MRTCRRLKLPWPEAPAGPTVFPHRSRSAATRTQNAASDWTSDPSGASDWTSDPSGASDWTSDPSG